MLRQTRRHSFIASLLGIRHVVVAVNKMDLVDFAEEVFERIREDYRRVRGEARLHRPPFHPDLGAERRQRRRAEPQHALVRASTLLHHLETVHIASDRNLIDFRFPVQYVNRPNLDFRGFCGTIASGVVRPGDEVMALPSGTRSRVRSIVTCDGERPEAFAPHGRHA